jgi:hypothetical protein
VTLNADAGSGVALCHPCSYVLGISTAFHRSARVLLHPAIEQHLLTHELLFVAIELEGSPQAGCTLLQTQHVYKCGDRKVAIGLTGDEQGEKLQAINSATHNAWP